MWTVGTGPSKMRGILILEIHKLPDDIFGKAQAEQLLADAKVQLLKKRKEIAAFVQTAESYDDTELAASHR
jgi:hypothetical protein